MNTVELTQFSLVLAFDVLEAVTADLTQEQADWAPPGIASSISAVYSHTLVYVDDFVQKVCIGQDYTVFTVPMPAEIVMQEVQIELSALHEKAGRVRVAAQDWLSSLTPEDLERKIATNIGELNQGQMVEAYIIWHINAHCGEISALKGCQGAKGYPW